MHIKWTGDSKTAYGDIEGQPTNKYFVGYVSDTADGVTKLLADVRCMSSEGCPWRHIDVPVDSIEQGKALCEAWEATGAY